MNAKSNRIGESRYNNQNEKMTIIAYRSATDMDIQFEDGTIRTSIAYAAFKKSEVPKKIRIEHKNHKIGQTNYNKQNEKMTIIACRLFKDIDVQFEDGTIRTSITYASFKKGEVPKKNRVEYKNAKIGQTNYNNRNEKMTIIAYRSSKDIDVQFEDGTIRTAVNYQSFIKKTLLKNKRKSICVSNTTRTMNNGMTATLSHTINGWIIKFKDGYEISTKNPSLFYKKTIYHPLRPISNGNLPITINNFYITSVAYRSENPNLYCTCTKCGYSDILTYDEMNEHQCERLLHE